jgi:serine/threonine protein kinase
MSPVLEHLAGLVASVADGWPQDWDALEARAADDRTRRALKSLRVVAAIADSKRGLPPSESPHGGDGSEAPRLGGESAPAGPEAPPPRARPAYDQWGRFVLLRKLGEGAYGDVYQAHDTQLDRDVALKLLKSSASSAATARRLLAEARMLARVRHPNVASVYGAGEHDGRAGMWMELVRGVNLEELLHARGPMSASEAALVGLDLCRALAAVHGAALVHRDVKASNVMREVGGRIVLTDFGAGRCRGLEPKRQLAGTPLYLAPEVLAGSEATVLSDIYSLGVVLFRLVTAGYPRRASRFGDLLDIRSAGTPTSLRDLRPDLPEAFVAAVEQALAFDPAARTQSAGALRAALGVVLGVPPSWRKARRGPGSVPPPSRGSRPLLPEPRVACAARPE